MKLAILLLCHKNPEQINMFLETLQHPDIEFFIHMDAKANITDKLILRPDIHILPDSLRVDVRWGEASMILATINLFQFAFKMHHYDYFWLCSGQDFPIKSIKQIMNYLHEYKGKNFIHLYQSANTNGGYENNFDKRNIIYYPHWLFGCSFLKRLLKRIYVCLTGGYNHTFAVFRRRDDFSKIKSYFGSQWVCLTGNFVSWCFEYLQKNPWYEQHLLYSSTPDECFWQTLFMLSPYKDTQHEYLHYIDWAGCKNSPNILTMKDYDKLKASKYLMARKFDITVDRKILEKLQEDIEGEDGAF